MSRAIKASVVGIAFAVLYVGVVVSTSGPVRPLLDAVAPSEPYHWVKPPPLFAQGNVPPHDVTISVDLTPTGVKARSVATPDGQAGVVLKENSIAPRAGETKVTFLIEPLDPNTVGPPPARTLFDGNAYRFTATYARSKAAVTLTKPGSIVMRFPTVATKILRWDGTRWTDINATPVGASFQIFGDTTQLGAFVAAGPVIDQTEKKKSSFPTAIVVAVAAAVAAVAAALTARVRSGRKGRRRRPSSKPPSGGRGPGTKRGR